MRYPAEHLHPLAEIAALAVAFILSAGSGTSLAAVRMGSARPAYGLRLIGTAIFEKGKPIAVFEQANRYWTVPEGERTADGVRLLKVRPDRIVLEREGNEQQILLFLGGWLESGAEIAPARPLVPR